MRTLAKQGHRIFGFKKLVCANRSTLRHSAKAGGELSGAITGRGSVTVLVTIPSLPQSQSITFRWRTSSIMMGNYRYQSFSITPKRRSLISLLKAMLPDFDQLIQALSRPVHVPVRAGTNR